jgi:uncharacterized protein
MTAKDAIDELFDIVSEEPVEAGEAEAASRATVVLRVHVQPGAGRTSVTGRHGDAVKLKVAAPPEGGRANDAVASLLATTLGVEAGQVELTSGGTSRTKRFTISGVDLGDFRRLLGEAVAGNARGRGGVR